LLSRYRRVIVIGLDGFEPRILESLVSSGQLPHIASLWESGGYARVRTTYSAQTPVAWSTFATGVNPGGHGIFDFVHRDPQTYRPTLSLNRYEQKNIFTPPKAVNLRRGEAIWDILSRASVPSIVLRCPCTYPPDEIKGRMLAGVGVPDLRGGLGTNTFYSTDPKVSAGESENLIRLPGPVNGVITTHLVGPRSPRTREDFRLEIRVEPDTTRRVMRIRSEGEPDLLEVGEGEWSSWLRVRFKTGPLISVKGMVRFFVKSVVPELEFQASPINFDPEAPLFPISTPAHYAKELTARLGDYYTAGMIEDHTGLNNGRIDESAFLEQCRQILSERRRMMALELDRFQEGFFYCLYDTPDRLQHMFWRCRDERVPDNPGEREWASTIDAHYRECDAIIGEALAHADEGTLFVVLSDHGMSSFRRGLHLNTWLHENGFLAFQRGVEPGNGAGDFFEGVDWTKTQAYALGLGAVYLNTKGREGSGIVTAQDAPRVKHAIVSGLTGLRDEERGAIAIRSVAMGNAIYSGACQAEAPDLVVNFSEGYRVSWGTPLGGSPAGMFEDNTRRWSGDHAIDPPLVPGVLLINRPFDTRDPGLVDLAPTILAALGLTKGSAMEGRSLLA
jgi:predicted AlkP superfamily phosphohydrolase/phosphomutase